MSAPCACRLTVEALVEIVDMLFQRIPKKAGYLVQIDKSVARFQGVRPDQYRIAGFGGIVAGAGLLQAFAGLAGLNLDWFNRLPVSTRKPRS